MPKLHFIRPRPPVRRDLQQSVGGILNSHEEAPEAPFYPREDDLSRIVRQLAAEGRSDADIGARTGVRSLDRVRRLREHLGCNSDPEREDVWDGLADDGTPPEAA